MEVVWNRIQSNLRTIEREELIKKLTTLLKDFKPFTIVFKGI